MEKGKDDPIYKFICKLWKWIKQTEIPPQSDNEAWDKVTHDASVLTAEHQGKAPIDRLFRMWVIAYLDYMSAVSLGKSIIDEQAEKMEQSA
jgi:hypothetical protein